MRKNRSKKLALNKDTVRQLDALALPAARGGQRTWSIPIVCHVTSYNGCLTLSGDGCGGWCPDTLFFC
jgi:hypothetical protein